MSTFTASASTQLENPNPAALTSFYGYQNDVVNADDPTKPQMVPTLSVPNEAQKTEPDKKTYVVFEKSLSGADPNYYYGKHFLYQGHENATTINGKKQGRFTRPSRQLMALPTVCPWGLPLTGSQAPAHAFCRPSAFFFASL